MIIKISRKQSSSDVEETDGASQIHRIQKKPSETAGSKNNSGSKINVSVDYSFYIYLTWSLAN